MEQQNMISSIVHADEEEYQQTLRKLRRIFDREPLKDSVKPQCQYAEAKGERLQHYRIPISCWEDVNQSYKRIMNLLTYCHALENQIGFLSDREEVATSLNVIDIYINPEEGDIHSLIKEKDVQKKELRTWNIFEERAGSKNDAYQFIGIFVGNSGAKVIKSLHGSNMVLHDDKRFNCFEMKECSPNIPDECISALRNVINCLMFEPLIEKCEFLSHVLDQLNGKSQGEQKELHEKSHIDSEEEGSENRSFRLENGNHLPKKEETEGSKWFIDEKSLEQFRKLEDEVEDLYEEMVAAISRSSLKEKYLSRLKGCRDSTCDINKISQELFKSHKIVKGCGFRRKNFQVDVDRLSSLDEQARHEQQIRDFLKIYGITDAKFNIVSPKLVEYSFVGACLAARSNCGTLGCFANYSKESDKEPSLCALHSRHILQECSEICIVNEENKLKRFGTVLLETNLNSGADIAATIIDNENISSCDKRFRNQFGVKVLGDLYRVEDSIDLQGQPVHLWGAKSKPGIGKVTVQDYHRCDDEGTCYIEVQDGSIALGKPNAVLAEQGDSGAIICMDEPCGNRVRIISMLMGEKIYQAEVQRTTTQIEENERHKKKYTTLPLSSGLETLEILTKGKFFLQGTGTYLTDSKAVESTSHFVEQEDK